MPTISLFLALASLATHSAPPPPNRVSLIGLDLAEKRGELAEIDTRDPRELQAWRVRFESPAAAPASKEKERERARVELWSGERLRGAIKGGKGESLVFQTSAGVGLVFELDELDALRFPARVPDLWSRPLEPASEGDRLYRRSRESLDVLEGGIESFAAEGLEFHDQRVGKKSIPWDEVAALFCDRATGKEHVQKPPKGVPVTLDLSDGGRLRGGLVRLSAQGVDLEREHGENVHVPIEALSLLSVEDPRLAFLSELAPAEAVDAAPFGDDLGMRWPHRVDLSVSGTTLAAGGRRYARGLGVHAPSRLVWKLATGWKSLRGMVAIDDETAALAAHGSVVFRVLADGKQVWTSGPVRGGEAARVLPELALAGVRELALEVNDGGDGFAGDRADWLELTLVR